ncbi:MAG: glycosyltransferase family 8 protein [Oscillospiraceae bacterium]|nr:glycosyltransferase family 8 protein [Oscillospiraceae bacterium]
MNVLVATDQNYLKGLKVALSSLLQHHKKVDAVNVYLLYTVLTEEDIAFLAQLGELYQNFRLHPMYLSISEYDYLVPIDRFSVEANYRLFVLKLFPESMERILWLDADLLVRRNILDFYNQPLDNAYAAVCRHRRENTSFYSRLQRDFGPLPQKDTFTSGFTLFHLPKLREDFSPDAFLEFFRAHVDQLVYPDQDILNVMIGNNVKWNDVKYNYYVQDSRQTEAGSPKRYFTPVLHFVTGNKPWMEAYTMRPWYLLLWNRYARRVGLKSEASVKESLRLWLRYCAATARDWVMRR